MPKLIYTPKRFGAVAREKIALAEDICEEYARQGYSLTLRQLFYQFVSRGYIPNKQTEYKNLGTLINDARLAGYIDWNHLEDRTRNLRELAHWSDPAEIVDAAASSYRTNRWARQPHYVEVWIEKDALVGVLDGVCSELDVPYFSCRGYASQSEVWRAARRLMKASRYADPESGHEKERTVTIIHLGDHDPSGIDMTRDIDDRLALFMETHGYDYARVNRIALNSDQVEQYNPPPNPAKLTDSRATGYIRNHGYESWELDALSPPVIEALIRDAVLSVRDDDQWERDTVAMERERDALLETARRFREEAV